MREPTSVAEEVRGMLGAFPQSERRAARTLLAHYPLLGLSTVAEFAGRAGVSSPTILRFVARLGFASYSEFQRRLREELEARLETPLSKSESSRAGRGRAAPEEEAQETGHLAFGHAVADNVRETFAHVPAAEFDAVAALLSDSSRPLHLLGGRFTDPLAAYAAAHLRLLRPNVRHIQGQPDQWRDQILDIGRRDVVILFDIRRYQKDLVDFAAAVAARHARIVLVTDQWLSPVARIAAHVLPARIKVPSAWDSSAALLALIEALVAAVTTRNWQAVETRIRNLEALRPAEAQPNASPPGAAEGA